MTDEKLETPEDESVDHMQAEDEQVAGDESADALIAENERLQQALGEAKDQALRAVAEAQNARRRAEQDVEKAHKFGLEKFAGDMIVVVDNLERALDAGIDDEGAAGFIEGVELTLKSAIDALKRHKIEQIDPQNEPFDPQLHQAMSAIEQADVEPNTVINVYQKGYTLHGRLVRPAMVVVSKAPVGE